MTDLVAAQYPILTSDTQQYENLRLDLVDLAKSAGDDSKRWFPGTDENLALQALCLCGEAGEFANKVKKIMRGSTTYSEVRQDLIEELSDVLTYYLVICNILGMDPLQEYVNKREINGRRFSRG